MMRPAREIMTDSYNQANINLLNDKSIAFGGIGYSVSFAGAIPVPGSGGAFVNIPGPYALDPQSNKFSMPLPGQLRYDGDLPADVIASTASASLSVAAGLVEGRIRLVSGGTPLPNTEMSSQLIAALPFNLGTDCHFRLNPGDIVTVQGFNVTDASDLTSVGIRLGVAAMILTP